ncbi:MAG TPA: hypothetical protein VJ440_05000 [Candidatus Brocadiaceae bacterium]|nr:hypothetical protein [Candidatus Brocadiaceae bacterium]
MTDADKINILIKEGEGLTVEYKEGYTPRIDRDIVTFYRDPRYSLKVGRETGEKGLVDRLAEKGGEDTEKIRSKGVEPAKGAEKKVVDGLAEGLVDTTQKTTQKILEAITNKPDITKKELAAN